MDAREQIVLRDENGDVLCVGEIVKTTIDKDGYKLDHVEFRVKMRTTIRRGIALSDVSIRGLVSNALHQEANRLARV